MRYPEQDQHPEDMRRYMVESYQKAAESCDTCVKRMSHRCDNYKAEGKYLSDASWCFGWKKKTD